MNNELEAIKVNTEYMLRLTNEYFDATGNTEINNREFLNWLMKKQQYLKSLKEYIDTLQLNPVYVPLVDYEVSKGQYDTLTRFTDLGVITPFTENIKSSNILEGRFRIYDNMPVVFSKKNVNNDLQYVNPEVLCRFITHNPGNEFLIPSWADLHNSKNANITVAVYGNIHDEDADDKYRMMQKLYDSMDKASVFDYVMDNDDYYCVVGSSRKLK